MCFFGVLNFTLWSQVIYLWESGANVSSLVFHPHGMRYILMLPYFIASEWLCINYNWLFSCTVPFLILFSSLFIVKSFESINNGLSENDNKIIFFIVCFLLMVISLFMNGRILFSIVGASLLTNILVKWENTNFAKSFFSVLGAFFLSSVSSGTFIVAVASFCIFLISMIFRSYRRRMKNLLFFIVILLIGFIGYPLFEALMMKNIDFFGGGIEGIFNMLGHGIGAVLINIGSEIIILFMVNIVLLLIVVIFLLPYLNKILIPLFLIGVSLCAGMFGISTMMMSIPPILVILCNILLKSQRYLRWEGDN